jgi:hypothetical protein
MRTDEIVVASLDDLPCRLERREGVSVRALVAPTIEPKAGEANLPTNRLAALQRPDLRSFRVYRRLPYSLRSDQVTLGS